MSASQTFLNSITQQGTSRPKTGTEVSDHTYARHVEWMRALAFDGLDLRRVTLVGQDWGG